MSRFVDRVVAAGCVRREPDPDDRRAQQVVLTEAGLDLLRRMWPVYRRGIEEHFAAHPVGRDPGAGGHASARGGQRARVSAFDGPPSGETLRHERASRS